MAAPFGQYSTNIGTIIAMPSTGHQQADMTYPTWGANQHPRSVWPGWRVGVKGHALIVKRKTTRARLHRAGSKSPN